MNGSYSALCIRHKLQITSNKTRAPMRLNLKITKRCVALQAQDGTLSLTVLNRRKSFGSKGVYKVEDGQDNFPLQALKKLMAS